MMKQKNNSNGLNSQRIKEAINRFTSTSAKCVRLCLDGNSDVKPIAKNQLFTLQWAVKTFIKHPSPDYLLFFLDWIRQIDDYCERELEKMKEEEIEFLELMAKQNG